MVKRTKYLNPQTSPFSRQPEPHSGPKPSPLPSCPCCVPAPHPIATPTTMQTSCRLRRTTQRRAARFRRHVALGSRPAPNAVQPARPHQAASQSGRAGREPPAQLCWASSPRHRRRSRTGVCDQADGRQSLSVKVHHRRAAARRLPYRRAASQWGGSLGRPHALSQMPAPPALPW